MTSTSITLGTCVSTISPPHSFFTTLLSPYVVLINSVSVVPRVKSNAVSSKELLPALLKSLANLGSYLHFRGGGVYQTPLLRGEELSQMEDECSCALDPNSPHRFDKNIAYKHLILHFQCHRL